MRHVLIFSQSVLWLAVSCSSERSPRNDGEGSEGIASQGSVTGTTTTTTGADESGGTQGGGASQGETSGSETLGAGPTGTEETGQSLDTSGDSDTSTGGTQACVPQGEQVLDFSFIWVANSSDGTISKIDTVAGVEHGRYIVRPDRSGNPSRTSVNRYGDVVVANRSGGITKVFADPTNCVESNGVPGIQTSSGPADVLAWGEEECVAWYAEIQHNNNRPVAWTNGVLNERTCQYDGVNVWTAYLDGGVSGSIEIALLDGQDGSVLETIPMPEVALRTHGFYGAAVDAQNQGWFSQLQGGHLARVATDGTVDTWEVGDAYGYGITVTSEGYVWICGRGTHRFDPWTQTFASVQTLDPGAYIHTGGCMGDGAGVLYRASHANVIGIDTETLATTVTLPVQQAGDDLIWGVAVDFDGYVWAIPRNSSRAYKLDPSNQADPIVLTVDGLINSYTYSDMTGFSLFSVVPG